MCQSRSILNAIIVENMFAMIVHVGLASMSMNILEFDCAPDDYARIANQKAEYEPNKGDNLETWRYLSFFD
ncbi:MAG: hypothetical protein ACXAEL_02780 [Candidatus Hodarchaeales archaeon]|jgi:hypothetical protein